MPNSYVPEQVSNAIRTVENFLASNQKKANSNFKNKTQADWPDQKVLYHDRARYYLTNNNDVKRRLANMLTEF